MARTGAKLKEGEWKTSFICDFANDYLCNMLRLAQRYFQFSSVMSNGICR
jgi:hypothetical protein